MRDVRPGSVLRMTSFTDHFVGGEVSGSVNYKAAKGEVAVFLLLGDEKKDGSEPLDLVKRMHELGWMTQRQVINKAKEAVTVPSKFGHSDIGDVLLRWVRGEMTDAEASDEIDLLMEDYREG